MTSNHRRYKMVATLSDDNKAFKELCHRAGVHEVDGFKLMMEAWRDVLDR